MKNNSNSKADKTNSKNHNDYQENHGNWNQTHNTFQKDKNKNYQKPNINYTSGQAAKQSKKQKYYRNHKEGKSTHNSKSSPYLSYKLLKDYATLEPIELINKLYNSKNLTESICGTRFTTDMNYLMISILLKISEINSECSNIIIHSIISNTDYIGNELPQVFNTLDFHKEEYLIFIQEYLKFSIRVIGKYSTWFPKIFLEETGNVISFIQRDLKKNNGESLDNLPLCLDCVDWYEKLCERRDNILYEKLKKQKESTKENQKMKMEAIVPIEYADFPVELSKTSLMTGQDKPIMPHRPKGSYESFERYLNTLFFLEYEDCYRSLRKSIYKIQINEKGIEHRTIEKENRDWYYYYNSEIISIDMDIQGILITIDFQSVQKEIKFTKRMIYGSLLVITDEDFSDYLFATVAYNPYLSNIQQRKDNYLFKYLPKNRYRIQASLININAESFNFLLKTRNKKLQIFESKAYFEAYVYVLKRIQKLNIEDLPFKDQLIDCDYTNMIPNYIYTKQNLFFDVNIFINPRYNMYPIELTCQWDESQLEAFKLCLSNKIALVQGPPGTGKTHVASWLTKMLINNTNNPIWVVCYTNHAWDQFLGHWSDFTHKIVRIGGRCNDERWKPYMLSNNQYKTRNKKIFQINDRIRQIADELEDALSWLDLRKIWKSEKVSFYFPYLYKKVISDFYEKIESKKHFYRNNSEIYESWSGDKQIKILLKKVIGEKHQYYEKYCNKFKAFFDDKLNSTLYYPKEIVKSDPQIDNYNNYNHINVEVNEESDDNNDDELLENLDRLELNNFTWIDENNKKQKGERKQLNASELNNIYDIWTLNQINYIINNYNVWDLGPSLRNKINLFMKRNMISNTSVETSKLLEYNELLKEKKMIELMQVSQIISSMNIVGMTTTGAAKYATILEENKFEIVIVEEAAEVLESHILTWLTKNTNHWIMIGDHKQLRPKPYNYEIGKKYNFDISWFERWINNKIPYGIWNYQRRMKPIFADFVRLIYGKETYRDHPTTKTKEMIKGLNHEMYLINHTYEEKSIQGLASKSNEYEAKYWINWCNYFILQGYESNRITILSLYVGQVLLLRKTAQKFTWYKEVKISSVDNYQGEENDIILVSLVRSNKEGDIGFLKTFNRVCVAFSRAKWGMYVIGNFDCLIKGEQKYSYSSKAEDNVRFDPQMKNVWYQIKTLGESKQIWSNVLTLSCEKHKKQTWITKPEDFSKVPEGGCGQPCCERMKCGHVCENTCHIYSHENVKCYKACGRTIEGCNHKCLKKCFEKCTPCPQKVRKQLQCGHYIDVACSFDISKTVCNANCERIWKCNHKCKRKCFEKCDWFECQEQVLKQLSICKHIFKFPCYLPEIKCICPEQCLKWLECGHKCQGTCGKCLRGTWHVPCAEECNRSWICGHLCKQPCSLECLCKEKCENICIHGYCTDKCCEDCISCQEDCTNNCPHYKCTQKCGEICLRPRCNSKCPNILSCGHKCIGICGERCPSVCRVCDPTNECFNIFFGTEGEPNAMFYETKCGHILEVSGIDYYFDQDKTFNMTVCPKCKTIWTQKDEKRYCNIIKERFSNIQKVKKILLKRNSSEENKAKSLMIIDKISKDIENSWISRINQLIPNLKSYIPITIGWLSQIKKDELTVKLNTTYNLLIWVESFLWIEYYSKVIHLNNQNKKNCELYLINFNMVQEYFKEFRSVNEHFYQALERKVLNMCVFALLCNNVNLMFSKKHGTDLTSIINSICLCNFQSAHLKSMNIIPWEEAKKILRMLGTQWYWCPNGHPYVVGECGRTMEQSFCPDCGEIIGGRNHQAAPGNEANIGLND